MMKKLYDLSFYQNTKIKHLNKNENHLPSIPESNDQVIIKLQNFVANAPLEDDHLSSFVDLLIKKFNWRTSHPDEIDKCKNIVLDLVSIDGTSINTIVERFISHFRTTDSEHLKVDICSRIFESVHSLKKHIRAILTNSPDDVDLKGDDYELMYELLGYHSSGRVKKNVVAIFPSTHKNPRFNGLRCFFYRRVDGLVEFFSYARCCDNVKTRGQILREHICDMLIEIYKLTPRVLGTITQTIENSYPHHNVQIEHHISFTKAILYISRRIPSSRTALYNVLIKKLTIIDSEIKLGDPNSVDVEKFEALRSQKLKEMAGQLINGQAGLKEPKLLNTDNPDWFNSIYEKLRTEEDVDDMSQKLDFLMGIVFEELECVLKDNIEKSYRQISLETINYSSDSEEETVSTPIAKNEQREFIKMEDTQYTKQTSEYLDSSSSTVCSASSNLESSYNTSQVNQIDFGIKSVENKFKSEFDKSLLVKREIYSDSGISEAASCSASFASDRSDATDDTHNTTGSTVSDVIVVDLFHAFDQIILPTYNCKYVQFIYFFVLSLNHKWVRMFLQRLFSIVHSDRQDLNKRRTAASYISSFICRSNYILPSVVCSSFNHLAKQLSQFNNLALNPASLKSDGYKSDGRRKNIKYFSVVSTRLSLFYSILQDILYIICYRTDLISAFPSCVSFIEDEKKGLIAYLDSYLKPLTYCRDSVITEAIKSTAHFPNLVGLHTYLISNRNDSIGDTEVSEEFKWSLYSPIDSFFPFDPYLLNHSRYYIRDKYRSETTGQLLDSQKITKQPPPSICKLVKREVCADFEMASGSASATTGFTDKPDETENRYEDINNENNTNKNKIIKDDLISVQQPVPVDQVDSGEYENRIIDVVVESIKKEKQLEEQELKNVSKHLHDSRGFSSISRSIKARLDGFKRTYSIDHMNIESDYDFWGYEKSIEELEKSPIPQTSPIMKSKKHVILGIDQLGDLELSLCDTLMIEEPEKRKHGLLDLLMSSRAYKSASMNCKRARATTM